MIGLDAIGVGVGCLLIIFFCLPKSRLLVIHCVGASAEAGPAREQCDDLEVWLWLAVEYFERGMSRMLGGASLRMFALRLTIVKRSLQIGFCVLPV